MTEGVPGMQQRDGETLLLAAVDDHPVVLRGILWTVQRIAPWILVIATGSTVDEVLAAGGQEADVILLDLDLSGDGSDVDPTENVQRIRACGPEVIVFTAELRPVPLRLAIAAGAAGLALKTDSESSLVATIAAARSGNVASSSALAQSLLTDAGLTAHLAPRQRQVLELLAQGVTQHEAGRLMDPPIAADTVITHLRRAVQTYRDLGRPTYGASDAVRHAFQDGHLNFPRRSPPFERGTRSPSDP